MEELIDKKDKLSATHAEIILESYERMGKTVENALKEHKTDVKGDANILSNIKAIFSFDRSATLGMTGAEKLEYAKMEYGSRKDAFDAIKEKLSSGQESVFKSIDEQLEIARRKIDEIDKKLDTETDSNKREELKKNRDSYNVQA